MAWFDWESTKRFRCGIIHSYFPFTHLKLWCPHLSESVIQTLTAVSPSPWKDIYVKSVLLVFQRQLTNNSEVPCAVECTFFSSVAGGTTTLLVARGRRASSLGPRGAWACRSSSVGLRWCRGSITCVTRLGSPRRRNNRVSLWLSTSWFHVSFSTCWTFIGFIRWPKVPTKWFKTWKVKRNIETSIISPSRK